MLLDPDASRSAVPAAAPRRGTGRGPGARLRAALLELAGNHGELLTHSEKPWASITFSGTRHRVELQFRGEDAVEAGECFNAFLPEHEFAIPGQLVADASVVETEHRLLPEPELRMTAELLLLDDA